MMKIFVTIEYYAITHSQRIKHNIFRLPPFIILYIQRFTKNTFYVEKNPTIVNFPIKSIEFGDFLTDEAKKKYPNGAPYDLIANVVHEGAPTSGTYKLHILHKGEISN